MSTTIKHVRMAPTGAKPTNPKYTLTLTRGEMDVIRRILRDWFLDTLIAEDEKSDDVISVLNKLNRLGLWEGQNND